MSYTKTTIQDFLAQCPLFEHFSADKLAQLTAQGQLVRYRMGQTILVRDAVPQHISLLCEGQARLLGYAPQSEIPVTLQRLQAGALIGWISVLRGVACETVTAATETLCLTLTAATVRQLLQEQSQSQGSLIEVFECLSSALHQRADRAVILQSQAVRDEAELARHLEADAIVQTLAPGKYSMQQLDDSKLWWLSSGEMVECSIGSCLPTQSQLTVKRTARFIGIPQSIFQISEPVPHTEVLDSTEIPYSSDLPSPTVEPNFSVRRKSYPFVRGRGSINATIACFAMLSQYWQMPFRREVIERVLTNQVARSQGASLQLCGAIAELMGINAQLIQIDAIALTRIQTPALVKWQDGFAILYEISGQKIVLADPERGILKQTLMQFCEAWGEEGQILLLQRTKHTPTKRFGLSWFLPALARHRVVLLEVLIASFVAQLFGLANPLVIQLIIDKVIVQNSIDTLNVLAILLIVLSVFEGLFNSLRTYLFVDTTNRIDSTLGSEIIDHLLRLPLRYFERRPVGELSSRANELENIRQFLTGTALTVVLDAVFSVIYIVAMIFYSWILALVALATIPIFAFLTFITAPIIRRQLRTKAERNAETQSYLVEVLSGIQTVKAQNIELRSRWQWQDRYTNFVNAGFQTVITSTAAGTINDFLNKLSGLLVLWVGVYLVLQGQLTLGQLIAFRIIAGYVTSPLLRLTQLWQTFQETALSLERLGDILDTPPEADDLDRQNIPMPLICGTVIYDEVSFRFGTTGAMQLDRISLEIPAGQFVGVVGQSGSGKSTLTKLLSRLYDPVSGRILIDGYDISKVELYSLRSQIGVVLQDSLLFDGTVRENIALTNPDATPDEIINAAKIAAAHDFIMTLPNGYNTRVGERGSALSGGQRQRIAIARVILQNPRLLILDEATSALDYQSERQVCSNLAAANQDRTVFFITHRLNTIQTADHILLLDQGTIAEQGTHTELMQLRGRYYALYEQQKAQL